MMDYDCSGWATKANVRCSDGRMILPDAFKHLDGKVVPLVWNHCHSDVNNVLGQALLEHRPDGMYTYVRFNESESGQAAKMVVQHGDVDTFSIYADCLKQIPIGNNQKNVQHGEIREVSLVLAGANKEAKIESVLSHSEDGSDFDAVIYSGDDIVLSHSEDDEPAAEDNTLEHSTQEDKMADTEEKTKDNETVEDVFNTLTEKQKNVVYAMLGAVAEGDDDEEEETKEDKNTMGHSNIFENGGNDENTLSHSEIKEIFSDGQRYGSLKESVLQHGITNIDYLFPEATEVNKAPSFIKRDTGWVGKVLDGVHNSPFSRIKSTHANITADEARAKGYVKGNQKTDEVFTLLKRTTEPTTIYKHQSFDRDDIIDITDFDMLSWVKAEMRLMFDEERARAYLVGDGRSTASNDKINEQKIRPIWTDADLYTYKCVIDATSLSTDSLKAKEFIRSVIKSRKHYKGSGSPTMFIVEDMLNACLLLEDANQRFIYDSVEKLATTLRVKEIVPVPVMDGLTREVGANTHTLQAIIVNLADYYSGADKGGAINFFDDFDIDYNKQKFLLEARNSGALVTPYSAIAVETSLVTPVETPAEG